MKELVSKDPSPAPVPLAPIKAAILGYIIGAAAMAATGNKGFAFLTIFFKAESKNPILIERRISYYIFYKF